MATGTRPPLSTLLIGAARYPLSATARVSGSAEGFAEGRRSRSRPMNANDDRMLPRRPGRPRRWTSNAERARAYRARKAADFAEPARLRSELADQWLTTKSLREELARERKRSSALRRALDRSNQRAHAAGSRADNLEHQLDVTRTELDRLRSRVRDSMGPARFAMNRAERRALARRR